MSRRIRVGIDTGGTFTDVVALDEDSGQVVTTKTPSTPADPAEGFLAGIEKVLALLEGAGGEDVAAVSHGTTVATNQLLEGKVGRLGFVTTEGYDAMLEIARQSVPDGYGNSYFWVKPPRIVPRDLVRSVGGRLDVHGREVRPFDEEEAREVARWFRDRGVDTLGVCFLHAYADPGHEERMRRVLAEEHPGAVVSLSSEVLREYREYERAMTTLVDAAVKPRLAAYVSNISARLASYVGGPDRERRVPFYVMKSNGGVLSADEVVHQPITTVLSGPAAGALGAALIAQVAGFDRVLTCDGGGTSTDVAVVVDGQPTLTTEGTVGAFPSKIPMIDVVTVGAGGGSIAHLSAEGALRVGPAVGRRRPRTALLRAGRHRRHHHRRPCRPRPHPSAPARRGDPARRRRRARRGRAARRGARPVARGDRGRGPRDLRVEPGQRPAAGHRQARPRRPRLHADDLRRLGLAPAVPPDGRARHPDRAGAPRPGQRLGVRAADRRREERLRADPGRPRRRARRRRPRQRRTTRWRGWPATPCCARGSPRTRTSSPAPPTCATSARPSRCGCRCRMVTSTGRRWTASSPPSTPSTGGSTATTSPATPRSRSSGSTSGSPASAPSPAPSDDASPRLRRGERPRASVLASPVRPVCFDADDGLRRHPVLWRPDLAVGTTVEGPAIIEEYGSTVPLHPGFAATVDAFGNLLVRRTEAGRHEPARPDRLPLRTR